jgi:hypothetical protein
MGESVEDKRRKHQERAKAVQLVVGGISLAGIVALAVAFILYAT